MNLDLGDNVLGAYDLAEEMELDCGVFDLVIRQAAMHNERFKAAVTRRALQRKRKSLVVEEGTITGGFEDDVEVYIETILVRWGTRPLRDKNGEEVLFNADNLRALFKRQGHRGRVLFGKIVESASTESAFKIEEKDLGNSSEPSGSTSKVAK